jgi:hypothetical protein
MTTVTKNRNFLKWQNNLNIDNYEITFILKKVIYKSPHLKPMTKSYQVWIGLNVLGSLIKQPCPASKKAAFTKNINFFE